MFNKIKQNWTYVVCAVIGVLNFILFVFPYVSAFVSYDLGSWGGKQTESQGFSGYKVMDKFWELEFNGVMSALLQIFILIAGIVLLAWGVCGILKGLGYFDVFPNEILGFESKKLGFFGLIGMAGLNVLLFIFLISLCASNSYESESYSAGIRLSAGIFISLVFNAAAVAAPVLLDKYLPADGAESVSYVCSKCGKRAKAKDKFCSVCGGAIEVKVTRAETYVCSNCGKSATAKDKFCSACGGTIEVKALNAAYVCSNCGKSATEKDKFCSACGGAIKKEEPAQADTTSAEA